MGRHYITPDIEKHLEEEITLLKAISHPHVIEFYGFYEEPTRLLLVVELCQGGELLDKIVQKVWW